MLENVSQDQLYSRVGLRVGVQSGTVELDDLNTGSKACTQAGKPAIQLTTLSDQTAVIQLLVNRRVDATYQDSPVTDYYILDAPHAASATLESAVGLQFVIS